MEIIKKNDVMCIIRLICNNRNIAKLYDIIDNLYKSFSQDTIEKSENDILIEYYKNIGHDRSLKTIYLENKDSVRHFQYNNLQNKKFFPQISEHAFRQASMQDRIIVFELQYDSSFDSCRDYETMSDPINFQYFLLIMDYLEHKEIRYGAFVSGKKGTSIYTPLDDKIYHQIRTFLYFCNDNQNDKMWFSILVNNNNTWVRLFADKKDDRVFDQNFGRILPLFSIDQNFYSIIQNNYNSIIWNEDSMPYKNIIECYKSRISSKSFLCSEDILKYCKYDNYIEELIFLSTLNYILEDSVNYDDKEISSLHETCSDYAQGVFQLIENACYHAILNGTIGCGNFSIRIRKSSEIHAVLESNKTNTVAYYMEIYVTDLLYNANDFCGIVNKLYENIENRLNKAKDQDEIKLHSDVLSTRGKENCIKLSQVFGAELEKNDEYNSYLNNSINITYHYGLQILNNAISVGDGYIGVRSGEGKNNYYSDSNNNKYKDQTIRWRNGTAYVIYVPLNLVERIDCHDSIAISNEIDEYFEDSDIEVKAFPGNIELSLSKMSPCITPEEKQKSVAQLISKIDFEGTEDKNIYYIDCSKISKKFSYEIMAKVIFLCLTSMKINHVAIINVSDRQEVVKMFRQFALFYNRNGKNINMKDKSIFIVDINAHIDLMLKGTISDIRDDMYKSQIYGGVDDTTMRIIEHLAKRGGAYGSKIEK